MAALSSSLISVRNSQTHSLSGLSLMEVNQCLSSRKLFISTNYQTKAKVLKYGRSFTVQASGDGGRPSTASIFVGGFVLGGIVVGTLGCIYAPQISKALTGADRKDLMRKLPKFIYDEEKALERTRKILTEKIAQLNAAIDDVSSQLRTDDAPNGAAVNPDELKPSL
ncbi:hypothetical protein U1Q18_050136 [Sarracenia purpurea var. burkii]